MLKKHLDDVFVITFDWDDLILDLIIWFESFFFCFCFCLFVLLVVFHVCSLELFLQVVTKPNPSSFCSLIVIWCRACWSARLRSWWRNQRPRLWCIVLEVWDLSWPRRTCKRWATRMWCQWRAGSRNGRELGSLLTRPRSKPPPSHSSPSLPHLSCTDCPSFLSLSSLPPRYFPLSADSDSVVECLFAYLSKKKGKQKKQKKGKEQ